ncbi:MAG TPA: hypothetical protein VIL61_09145 [Nitrospiria bacterium]
MKRNFIIGLLTVLFFAAVAWATISTTGTTISGNGAVTLSSGGSSDLILDSASGIIKTNDTISDTRSCASGYTRVGLWCMDTDGVWANLRANATANEGSFTTTVFETGAKIVILKVTARVSSDATPSSSVTNCVLPGDSAGSCTTSPDHVAAEVNEMVSGTLTEDNNTITVRADSSGQVKTRCSAGTVGGVLCTWSKVGYMD